MSHNALLSVYLWAPAARPPAAGCSDTLHRRSRRGAAGAGCRQAAEGTAGGPRWSRSSPVGSQGPSGPGESRPHQSCQSRHTAGGRDDPPGLKTGSLLEERTDLNLTSDRIHGSEQPDVSLLFYSNLVFTVDYHRLLYITTLYSWFTVKLFTFMEILRFFSVTWRKV